MEKSERTCQNCIYGPVRTVKCPPVLLCQHARDCSHFACVDWKEKKPDVRGMVAMYLCGLLGESLLYHQQPNRVKNVYLAHADAIFAIIREADE